MTEQERIDAITGRVDGVPFIEARRVICHGAYP